MFAAAADLVRHIGTVRHTARLRSGIRRISARAILQAAGSAG
jgi:hypothetical protein